MKGRNHRKIKKKAAKKRTVQRNRDQLSDSTLKIISPLLGQLRGGTSVFYWIATLSVVNTVIFYAGGSPTLVVGLGITQASDAVFSSFPSDYKLIGLLIDLVFMGGYFYLGKLSNKFKIWPFLLGIVILILDSIIFLLVNDWLNAAFHILMIYGLFKGFMACRAANKIIRENK